MHTEDEARKLWCPMVRHVADSTTPPANRWNDIGTWTATTRCIASECAMWQWTTRPVLNADGSRNENFPAEGCCGLAGKP